MNKKDFESAIILVVCVIIIGILMGLAILGKLV